MRLFTPTALKGHRAAAITTLSAAFVLGGCQTITSKQDHATFDQQYSSGQYQAAADTALTAKAFNAEGESSDLLWALKSGSALSASGQFDTSNKVFDSAEEMIKEEDLEGLGRKGVEKVASVLVNNSMNRYTPNVYDGVFVNTYKALNDIFLEDPQNARIELNRAADRQRRAAEAFKKGIEEQKEKLAEEKKEAGTEDSANSALDFDKSKKASFDKVYEAYPELEEWAAYPDYVNPYTDYIHGLYFMLNGKDRGDFGKARDSIRRVAGMAPKNKTVRADLQMINNLARGRWHKRNIKPKVWVLFENGEAPALDETVIPLPLFLVSSKVDYAQLALPKLKMRDKAYDYMEVKSGKTKLGRTNQLADIDRVVQTEFKKNFPYKVTEAVTSSLIKAFIQYKMKEQAGLAGSLLSAVYQAATTHADTRSWTTLPKEVQVLRFNKPRNGKVQLNAPGLPVPLDIKMPDKRFIIIHVRAAGPASIPSYQVAGFDA